MNKKKLLIFLIALLLITTGCMSDMNKQKITIQKRVGEENTFEDFREVIQKEQVQKAIEIVENANWENEKIEMASYADYQFQFPFKNHNSSEDKIASYLLWVSEDEEILEIVTDSDRYAKLTKQDSEDLYEILIGDSIEKLILILHSS